MVAMEWGRQFHCFEREAPHMKSGTATALVADKSVSYGTERILAIVLGLKQEIKDREADFELRLKRTVEETQATTRKDSEQLIEKLKQDAIATATEWQAERQHLETRIASLECIFDTVNAAHTEKLDEHKELERKLNEALQSNTQLQLDLQQAVVELSSRVQAEASSEADRAEHGEVAAMVQSEVIRVRTLLDEIETKLADPSTELGSEMRLNRERGELHAYLKGLRYSLGELSLQTSLVGD